jgi:hypothetical protein
MSTWHIIFMLLVAVSITIAFIWLWKIDNQVKKLVRKNLRKLGFVFVVFLMTMGVTSAKGDPSDGVTEVLGDGPIPIFSPDELQQANIAIADVFGLQEEQAWRAGALAFLGNNSTMEASA